MHTPDIEKVTRLREQGREAHSYQLERGWSDVQMLREIPQLGSTKTYKRILDPDDDLSELNLDNQIKGFTAALALIEERRKSDRRAEPEYQDFANIVDSLTAVSRALSEESSVARFVAIQGENGTGKSTVVNSLTRRWGKIILPVEALDAWRDSKGAPLTALIKAYNTVRKGEVKVPQYPIDRFEALAEAIGHQRLIIVIDEAHYLGPRTLNDLKSLINKCSKLVIVCLFIPALLRRLLTNTYEEAIQLFGNRLCERVHLPTPPADEILRLLEQREIPIADAATQKAVAADLAKDAPFLGNWRYVGQFAREAWALNRGKALQLADFTKARDKAKEKRLQLQAKGL